MARLDNLVSIRLGYAFRTALEEYEEGDVVVFQAKDIGDDFSVATYPTIAFPGGDKHLLKQDDILLSARGESKAVVFRNARRKAVATASLFVLTPKSASVDPAYIAMFFNSAQGIKAYSKLSSGASVKSISKEDLGQINLPDIPLNKSRVLSGFIQTIDNHRRLLQQKQAYLDQLQATIISKSLKEGAAK